MIPHKLKRYSVPTFLTPQKQNKSDSQSSTHGASTKRKSPSQYSEIKMTMNQYSTDLLGRKSRFKLKKMQKIKRKQTEKEVLGNMILVKQINFKTVFEKFRSLPTKKTKYVLRGSHEQRKVTEKIVWKTKLNLQTSLLRSLLQVQQNIVSPEKEKKQFSTFTKTNLTIYPDELTRIQQKQKEAILKLVPYAQWKLRQVVNKFYLNHQESKIKRNYCHKVYRAARDRYRQFIQKLRLVTKLKRDHILATQRKIMQRTLNKCFERRDRVMLDGMRTCHIVVETKKKFVAQKLIMKAQNRILSALKLWGKNIERDFLELNKKGKSLQISVSFTDSIKIRPQSKEAVQRISVQTDMDDFESELETRKMELLKKFIVRRHLEKWQFHTRFRRNMQRCAIKLACAPKISIQRSLWRLAIYSQQQN